MFTGIIEDTGKIVNIEAEKGNLNFSITASFLSEISIDQSISHNGICLTVTDIGEGIYFVTAIKETLDLTNLGDLEVGSHINLERCMKLGGRLDGHMVQGHVDTIGICTSIENQNGSWVFTFSYPSNYKGLVISKGSICVNGVSLTIVGPERDHFSVAIIPYTFEHTNFNSIQIGDKVNLEFDIIGKYIVRQWALQYE